MLCLLNCCYKPKISSFNLHLEVLSQLYVHLFCIHKFIMSHC
eukprot:UN12695